LSKHYGSQVLGLEQFQVAHSYGSSHGLSRIIRLSYFEHPAYVAMLRRAFKLWRQLEDENGSGEQL
jgi:sarcosine oxidase